MSVEKPIFIIGAGRSGTTILYQLLSTHPEVCWFSNLTDRYPRFPALALLHRATVAPVLGKQINNGIIQSRRSGLRPVEGGNIYHSHCGFVRNRKTTEADLSPISAERFKSTIEAHQRLTNRNRFLSKQTANIQRLRQIHEMFPDAHYIHIIRDGRAVANSLFHVDWWKKIDIWWLDNASDEPLNDDRESIELCALHWQHNVEEILDNKHLFGDRYLELRYEALATDTRTLVSDIAEFCGLRRDPEFLSLIPENLPNMNAKWQEQLSEDQQVALHTTIGPFLAELGYMSAAPATAPAAAQDPGAASQRAAEEPLNLEPQ